MSHSYSVPSEHQGVRIQADSRSTSPRFTNLFWLKSFVTARFRCAGFRDLSSLKFSRNLGPEADSNTKRILFSVRCILVKLDVNCWSDHRDDKLIHSPMCPDDSVDEWVSELSFCFLISCSHPKRNVHEWQLICLLLRSLSRWIWNIRWSQTD